MRCICGGVEDFLRAYEEGKVPEDIIQHTCACGVILYIEDGTVWDGWIPLKLK